MKIIWRGNIFNPTGIATAYRELVKALTKKGVVIQAADIWHSGFDFNKGLEYLNNPIDAKDVDYTVFADYPHLWRDAYGKAITCFLHEGTRLPPGWSQLINTTELVMVPSQPTKNLFRINGVQPNIEVVPFGVNELYVPKEHPKEDDEFKFLYVNSWTGNKGDRKGADLLIKAFDEEFKEEEKVKLVLKVSTFWKKEPAEFYLKAIQDILGHNNKNILVNADYVPEEKLVEHFQKSDCFVMPTHGESFGLTAINAMACGLPVIITKDNNSGHMDFCRGKDSVLFIDVDRMEQADRRFFVEGNLQPIPSLESLKKQLRFAFENGKDLKDKALKNSEDIRTNWTWDKAADKFMEVLNG
jgi:glycosyltransferase involved in cell wall biosynthesis